MHYFDFSHWSTLQCTLWLSDCAKNYAYVHNVHVCALSFHCTQTLFAGNCSVNYSLIFIEQNCFMKYFPTHKATVQRDNVALLSSTVQEVVGWAIPSQLFTKQLNTMTGEPNPHSAADNNKGLGSSELHVSPCTVWSNGIRELDSNLPQWDIPFCKKEWKSGGAIRKVIL